MRSLLNLLLLVVLATPALAGDGVLEINQTCAVETGCFGADAPGFPVTINGIAGHSYRLTSNLRLDAPGQFDQNSTAIEIVSDRITLDLGGFQIAGPCLNGCPAGTGDGVSAADFNASIEVRNGTVFAMGRHGVSAGSSGIVQGVRATSNGSSGIRAGNGTLVVGSTSERNAEGISVGAGSAVSGCTARINNGAGIVATFDARIEENNALSNSGDGIRTGGGAILESNSVASNGGHGIVTGAGSLVRGNSVRANGTGATGDGIRADSGSAVKDNTVRFNRDFGLRLTFPTSYSGNTITSNSGGTVLGSPDLGGNYCDTPAGTCP